ncbi:MAG: aminomethyl-transferring glycine dehydrogenase subunit GcvPB [Desulfopila sp.]
MKNAPGTSGLILEEPLLWEKGKKGRNGMSVAQTDVPSAPLPEGLAGEAVDFPDLSEVDVVRHYTRLSQWNYGVDTGMYPLGSCTMKYNPKINEKQAASPVIAMAHPLLDEHYCQGTLQLIHDLERYLAAITGMDAVSTQPAAGAHGELAGMLIMSAYHDFKKSKRNKIIIPDTAHGTNPASAALCGLKPVGVKSGKRGILEVEDVARLMDDETAGIMMTNPNTLGLFEENIKEIAALVHEKGGLVYADGANMNAIMGIVDLKRCGVDILHLNLHKTFSTPHGGGGPGAGPVCVVEELEKFLPAPRVVHDGGQYRLDTDQPHSIGRIHGFFGNFGVLVRAYSYIMTMGAENLKKASQYAVLNACYLKVRIKGHLHLAYNRPCMHEVVFSDKLQQEYKVSTLDIAKRLMDCGYHPPTVYFPLVVSGSIMIEPTESECLEDLDRFVEVIKNIATEARENPELLKNSPQRFKVKRLDETRAARTPRLRG